MFGAGEGAGADFAAVFLGGAADGGAEVGVLLDEAGSDVVEQAEQVGSDEDLAVAAGSGADADGRDLDGGGELGGEVGWDAFDDEGEGAGGFDGAGVVEEALGVALDLEAAESADGLRRQSDVAHDGDVGAGDGGDGGGAADAAFELDGVGAALFDEAAGAFEGLLRADLVAHEGQVGDDEGAADAAGDDAGVVDHLVEGDGERVGLALDDHAEGVADEEAVDAGDVEESGGGVVVGGEHREAVAAFAGGEEVGNSDGPQFGGGAGFRRFDGGGHGTLPGRREPGPTAASERPWRGSGSHGIVPEWAGRGGGESKG